MPPAALALPLQEVHVWRAALEEHAPSIPQLQPLLSPEEVSRAEKFYFARDRDHFLISHGLLRVILGQYTGVEAAALRFSRNAYGKPALANTPIEMDLRWNLSHSGQWALYAVARGREVGVDVEQFRNVADVDRIVERFFAPRERAEFGSLPPGRRTEGFFALWTLKEAYIKGVGRGLSLPLDQFHVSPIAGESRRFCACAGHAGESGEWTLEPLAVAPQYAAAVAAEGRDWQLACWECTPAVLSKRLSGHDASL